MSLEEIAVRRAEQARELVAAELVGLRDREELDEEAGKLDQPVVGAPRMAVARADREAEPLVARGRCVEVVDCVNDMVETARHPASLSPTCRQFRHQRGEYIGSPRHPAQRGAYAGAPCTIVVSHLRVGRQLAHISRQPE